MAIPPCTGILIRLTDPTEGQLVEKVRGLSRRETLNGTRKFFIGKEEITNYRRPRSRPNHDRLLSTSKTALIDELEEPYVRQITEAIERYVEKHKLFREELNLTTVVTDIRLYGKEQSHRVMLQPRGWVACRLSVVKEVRKVIAKIPPHIPESLQLGSKIEAGNSGLTWNMADWTLASLPERLSLGEGFTLPTNGFKFFMGVKIPRQIVEIGEIGPSRPSSCGLLCCIEVLQGHRRQLARVCRIGGVIEILDQNGAKKLVAVTVAHGLLDYVLAATSRNQVNGHKHGFKGKGTAKSGTSEQVVEETPDGMFYNTNWTPIKGFHAINWLGNVWSPTPQHSSHVSVGNLAHLTADADFALLDVPFIPGNLFSAGSRVQRIDGLVMDNELCTIFETRQELRVIIEPDRTLEANLLGEAPIMFVRGRRFATRMIRLKNNEPLPGGTSGCWVVNGNKLCGVIVASNDTEPIAHMVTAEKVFTDIEKTIGHWPKIHAGEDQPAAESLQAEITKAASEEVEQSHNKPISIRSIRVEGPSRSSSLIGRVTASYEKPSGFEDRLFSSMVASAGEGNEGHFVPRNVLTTLITYSSVSDYLTGRLQIDVRHRLPELVEYVIQSARRLFAILVLADACEILEKMCDEGLSDDDLPLHTDIRDLYRGDTDITSEPQSFKDLSRAKIMWFDRQQWAMLAPKFTLDKDGESLFYRLSEKVVLPWVASDRVVETGRSTIRRIRIHPAHYDFSQVSNAEVFAVKKLRSLAEEEFHQEISALIKLPRHMHLNTLLTSYEWRESHFLVFPWADGNLIDLWTGEMPRPTATADLVLWFIEQCAGLAEGLTIIHGTSKLSKKVFGRHGDIKPQNILWYRRSESDEQGQGGMGVLKISDFGETKFHRDSTRERKESTRTGVTISYSAPEFETERGGPVSRAFDVWSLGCVYLEFATWLLRGAEGVHDFATARSKEIRKNFMTDTFYEVLPFPDNTAVVKSSVREYIRSLRTGLDPHSHVDTVLNDFLGLALDKMVVLVSERARSVEVLDTLQSLLGQLRVGKAQTPLPRISSYETAQDPVQEGKPSSKTLPLETGNKNPLKNVGEAPAQDTVPQSTFRGGKRSSPISGGAIQILSLQQIEEEIEEGERKTDASGRVRETWRRNTRRTAGLGYASLPQGAKASYPSASRLAAPEGSEFTSMSGIQLLEAERALLGQLMAIKEVQIQRGGQAGADSATMAHPAPSPNDGKDYKMSLRRRWKLFNERFRYKVAQIEESDWERRILTV